MWPATRKWGTSLTKISLSLNFWKHFGTNKNNLKKAALILADWSCCSTQFAMFGLALALAAYLLLSSLNWACSAGCFQANDTLALLAPVLLNRMQGQNSAFSLQNWKLKQLILISGEVTEGCGNGGGGGRSIGSPLDKQLCLWTL